MFPLDHLWKRQITKGNIEKKCVLNFSVNVNKLQARHRLNVDATSYDVVRPRIDVETTCLAGESLDNYKINTEILHFGKRPFISFIHCNVMIQIANFAFLLFSQFFHTLYEMWGLWVDMSVLPEAALEVFLGKVVL